MPEGIGYPEDDGKRTIYIELPPMMAENLSIDDEVLIGIRGTVKGLRKFEGDEERSTLDVTVEYGRKGIKVEQQTVEESFIKEMVDDLG